MTAKPVNKLRAPAKGEVITSDFLRRLAARVEANVGAIGAPRDVSDQADDDDGVIFDEVSRTTSTVDVSGVEIERIDAVTFENEASGLRMTLVFDND